MFQFNKGFSLIEVLVAFVVMGLVVGTLLSLFGSSLRSVALSDEYSFAVQIAESRLAALGNAIKVEDGNVNGDEPGTGYHWTVRMSPIELSEQREKLPLPLQLYRVDVVVNWQSGDNNREFHLSSLRFGEEK